MVIRAPSPFDTIGLSILFFAAIIAALSFEIFHEEYNDLEAAKAMLRANSIADELIVTDAAIALERGLTALALGYATRGDVPEALLGRIAELRARNDQSWRNIAASVSLEAGRSDKNLERFLLDSLKEKVALNSAREKADACFSGKPPCAIRWDEWITVASGFVVANERLREAMLGVIVLPQKIALLNLSVKRLAWLAAEYAGCERAVIAYHTGAALPLSGQALEELHAWRGIVMNSLDELAALRNNDKLGRSIADRVTAMQAEFLQKFEALRQNIYAESVGGNYSVSGIQWLESATEAINSILLISDAVSAETKTSALRIVEENTTKFMWHIVMLSIVLLTVPFSFFRVRQTANELFNLKELAEKTLYTIEDAVITVTLDGRVGSMNPAAESLTGWRENDARDQPLSNIFRTKRLSMTGEQHDPVAECLAENRVVSLSGNVLLVRRDGTEVSIEDTAVPLADKDGKLFGCMLLFYNANDVHHVPHLLSYHATHDVLTELLNRREFEKRLGNLVANKRAPEIQHVLCMLDLDRFKIVNDACGHAAGDKLLRQLAYQLKGKMRKSDILARLGGDEFGALLENCSLDHAWQIAEELRQTVHDFTFQWEGVNFKVGVSIGMVQVVPGAANAENFMKAADAACYAAKEGGRNRVNVATVTDGGKEHLSKGSNWVERLQSALENGYFVLFAQQIHKLRNPDGIARYEFLLRMSDGNALIPPLAFLPDAERHGLTLEIDRWVINEAMRVISDMKAAEKSIFFINISGASIASDGFADYVSLCAAKHGVHPEMVCFELPETVALLNIERLQHLARKLKPAGFHFGLDSFGSGLTSFFQLKNLPVDFVKLDGRFVRSLPDEAMAQTMLHAIREICGIMRISTIATNVESEEALDLLPGIGIELASGSALSSPEASTGMATTFRTNDYCDAKQTAV